MSNTVRRGNAILEGLAARERHAIFAVAAQVSLRPGEVICAFGKEIKHVYFPRQGVISLFAVSKGAPNVGVGIVGGSGMFGLGVAVGETKSHLLALAQGDGTADRIETDAFVGLLSACPSLRDALFAYSQRVSNQLARNVVCVARHRARIRLARWMLDITTASRLTKFSSTQEATAIALGLQRPAVSYAASALQRLGLISYLRGEVTILDRKGLKALACKCSA